MVVGTGASYQRKSHNTNGIRKLSDGQNFQSSPMNRMLQQIEQNDLADPSFRMVNSGGLTDDIGALS